jgi:hypothetical protein
VTVVCSPDAVAAAAGNGGWSSARALKPPLLIGWPDVALFDRDHGHAFLVLDVRDAHPLRAPVARVIVRPAEGERYAVKLEGHLAELVECAGAFPNGFLVVAEDGFEPPTHGL